MILQVSETGIFHSCFVEVSSLLVFGAVSLR